MKQTDLTSARMEHLRIALKFLVGNKGTKNGFIYLLQS